MCFIIWYIKNLQQFIEQHLDESSVVSLFLFVFIPNKKTLKGFRLQ